MATRSATFLPLDPKTAKALVLWLKICNTDGTPTAINESEWTLRAEAVAKALKEQLKPDGEDSLPSS